MLKTSKIALAAVLALGTAGLSVAQDTQPHVCISHDLVAAASAFETYTRTAGAINAGFAGPGDVAGAVRVAASHEPRQIEAGMIAYAAMSALEDEAFVEGVQRIVRDPAGREALVRRLTENPEAAADLPGADEAANHARSALLSRIEPLLANGARVKRAAYEIQHHEWSKAMVGDAHARLALVKQLATQPFSPTETDATQLYQALTAPLEGHDWAPASPVVARGLALAALALAGKAGEENAEALRSVVSDPKSAGCMHMAKLNLFQCMAVAGPHYEDVFCISQHAMLEAGRCMAEAAGADAAPRALQTADTRSMLIPIAHARSTMAEHER